MREQAVGAEVLEASAGQLVIKIVHDELTAILGGGEPRISGSRLPAVVMLVGLQGRARRRLRQARAAARKQGRARCSWRPIPTDRPRPISSRHWASGIDVPVYRAPKGTEVLDICRGAVAEAKKSGRDTVVLDTAGRTSVDQPLLDEIGRLAQNLEPAETLLVVDAMVGQESVAVAQAFDAAAPVYRVGADQGRWRRPRRRGAVDRAVTGLRSSSWAWARRSTISRRSIPTAWPGASWAWATC